VNIENPRIVAEQLGANWRLTVHWTETFTPDEISNGFEFEDWITFWEWDDTDHDHILNGAVDRFRPTSLKHNWEWAFTIPGENLDTELGGEEIRAQVFLRNATTSSSAINRLSPILQISPD
jgi:hypothetical protein